MIIFKNRLTFLTGLFSVIISFSACKKAAWDDHNTVINQDLKHSLLDAIKADPSLSTFTQYLQQTGYSDTLALSKSFTVWAPDNKALESLDKSILNSPAELKRFVAYHIAYQAYFTNELVGTANVKTLQGKAVTLSVNSFEEAEITHANRYVKNGVLHVINQASAPKMSAWEYVQQNVNSQQLENYINKLYYKDQDLSNAVFLYFDPITFQAVYQEGTAKEVIRNRYFQRVANLSSEDSLATYIILTDQALADEMDKMKPYFQVPATFPPTYTDSMATWSAIKDLVIPGIKTEADLGSTVTSYSGVRLKVDAANIVEKRKLSNGIAYLVSKLDYQILDNKIPAITIQGELTDSIRTPSTPVRKTKRDNSNGIFTDYSVEGITSSPSPLYFFRYRQTLHSVKYRVFVRSIHDLKDKAPISMRVDFSLLRNSPTADLTKHLTTGYFSIPYFNTIPDPYAEKEVGTFTATQFGSWYVYLASAATGVTSATATGLSLDYIKLVPIN